MQDLDVSLEFTPNPNTLKFVISKPLLEKGAVNFTTVESAAPSPLAKKLFGLSGISGVLIGRNFVTLTKAEGGDWEAIYQSGLETIKSHLTAGEAIMDAGFEVVSSTAPASSELDERIKKILDEEIRPAVAMDGGDITFDKFENGIVYLQMQGSCSGCPSSTMTLKMGIETRLKEAIPEVQEVVSV